MIALDRIADDAGHLRRLGATADQDAALEASIRAIGVVQPVLVRPEGDGYVIVAGRRRLRAARAAGLTEIPAEVREFHNGDARAAEAAENMVRAAMAPLDQWRAIVALQERGFTLDQAALALGLPERLARRLDKLGRLHPAMLAAIEKHGMPREDQIATIASAPHAVQKSALPKKSAVDWWAVERACKTTRIPRALAIFDVDTAGVVFEEDLFAEPGDDDQFTTADIAGFIRAQEAALTARVVAGKKKGERISLATFDVRQSSVVLPAGWRAIYVPNRDKVLKGDSGPMRFVAVQTGGYHVGKVEEAIAEETRKTKPARASSTGSKASSTGEDDASAEPKPAFTKAGVELLARAKTEALRARLRSDQLVPLNTLLACMVLLLHARNVDIRGGEHGTYGSATYKNGDLAARLVGPDGDFLIPDEATLRSIAGEALARSLDINGPDAEHSTYTAGSGAVAEWIGAAIGADRLLSRLDTPEFLTAVTGDELRRAAESAQIKPAKSVKALREQLAGEIPDWRPQAAQFGAPGPRAPEPEEIEDEDLEDAA